MKPASPRTVARYVVGLTILVAAQQTAIANPIHPAIVVGANVGARLDATVPPSESQSALPAAIGLADSAGLRATVFGTPPQDRSDAGLSVAATVMSCWTGA